MSLTRLHAHIHRHNIANATAVIKTNFFFITDYLLVTNNPNITANASAAGMAFTTNCAARFVASANSALRNAMSLLYAIAACFTAWYASATLTFSSSLSAD